MHLGNCPSKVVSHRHPKHKDGGHDLPLLWTRTLLLVTTVTALQVKSFWVVYPPAVDSAMN